MAFHFVTHNPSSDGSGAVAPGSEVQIFVKTIRGKTITINMNNNDTTSDIMEKIQDKEGIPAEQQRLIFAGKQMSENSKVKGYGVDKGNTIYMSLRLRGGLFQLPEDINTQEGLMRTFNQWSTKLNDLETENMRLKAEMEKGNGTKGIRRVIQNGSKELVPKKTSPLQRQGPSTHGRGKSKTTPEWQTRRRWTCSR